MTAAPYFHTQFTAEASKELTEQVQQRFLNVVENLSKTLGLNVRQVFDNLGGFHDDKLNSQVRELSYTIEFDDADIDKINLFTCLLGDLGHEVQNSVYNIRYTDKDDTKANGIEYTLKCDTSDRHKLADKLEELGIENYSIDRDGIHMLYFNGDNEADFQKKWKKVTENIEGVADYQKIRSNYFEAADRAKLYDEELKKFGEDNTQTNLHEDLYNVLADIAYDLEFTPDMIKEVSDKFKEFSYEQQEVIAKDLQRIYDNHDNLQSKFDAYIQGLTGKELKASEEDNVQINQDLRSIIQDISKDLKWDTDTENKVLNKVKDFSEEKQKSIAKDLHRLRNRLNYSRRGRMTYRDLDSPRKKEDYNGYSQRDVDDYLENLNSDFPLITQKLYKTIKSISEYLKWSSDLEERYLSRLERFPVEKQDSAEKKINDIYEKFKANKETLQEQFDAYIDDNTYDVSEELYDLVLDIANEVDIDADRLLYEFGGKEDFYESFIDDLQALRNRGGNLKREFDLYLEKLLEVEPSYPAVDTNLADELETINNKLSWDDKTFETYLSTFKNFSYRQQHSFVNDLYKIYKNNDLVKDLEREFDNYIQKLKEEIKEFEERNARKEELKKSEKDNAPKSKRIEELKKYGEEELKKAGKDKLQLKEDLLDIIITIADELGIEPDSYLKEVEDFTEKAQDEITEDLKKLRERSGYSKSEVDKYFDLFTEDNASPLISPYLYNELFDLLETLGLKGDSLYDVLENTYLSKFEKFSYEQQNKFAKEINDFYEKYKDNKQELQSQLDKYIDNLNVELKKLEEDDLRRKKGNEQRVDTKNDRLDTQKLPEHKVRKQDGRLRELLNEALKTNQKYRDSGGTEAIQTGETLKEGTNAITPGQTYEDYVKNNQDGVAYFEAFIPVYDSIFKEFADSEGTISVEALEYLHPDIMKMIVYRIPTEGRHSIMPVKGIQFMPIEMGGTIMLPDEMIHLLKQTI